MKSSLLGLKGSELRAACARLRSYLAAGDSEHDACEKMGLDWDQFEELRRLMYEAEGSALRKRSPEEVYVDYVIAQSRNIKDLTDMLERFEDSRQFSAMVGAVRARADLLDKIIDRGQDLGFIEKKAERREIVAGLIVSEMSSADLKAAISKELGLLGTLTERAGEERTILDVEPGELYLPTPKEKVATVTPIGEKISPHARSRVHKGRRVVKEKKPG